MDENSDMKQVILIIATPGHGRDGLSALLTTSCQASVLVYANGQAAIATDSLPPSLVILDIDPHGNTDWKTLRHVKSRWPDTPCLALIAHTEQRQPAHDAGANATWLKGFPAHSLIAIIEDLLSR